MNYTAFSFIVLLKLSIYFRIGSIDRQGRRNARACDKTRVARLQMRPDQAMVLGGDYDLLSSSEPC